MNQTETATRCSCGRHVTLSEGPRQGAHEWEALCLDCYDGTEDAGPLAHIIGRGRTIEAALWDWQDGHDEAHEVEWVLVDLHGDIAQQVSIEAERQRGWVASPVATGREYTHATPRYWQPPAAREETR